MPVRGSKRGRRGELAGIGLLADLVELHLDIRHALEPARGVLAKAAAQDAVHLRGKVLGRLGIVL